MSVPVLRVAQLDACELDTEVENVVLNQFRSVLDSVGSISLAAGLNQAEPEFLLALRSIYFWYSVKKDNATLGQRMMGLQYRFGSQMSPLTTWHKSGLFILTAIVPWLHERLAAIIPEAYRPSKWSRLAETALDACTLINFLRFLISGAYPVIKERLLRIRPASEEPPQLEEIDYGVMNRELLWHGFADFLFFLIPLVNFRKFTSLFHRITKDAGEQKSPAVIDVSKPITCSLCNNLAIIPTRGNCSHVFCHYCSWARIETDKSFDCPSCGAILTAVSLTNL